MPHHAFLDRLKSAPAPQFDDWKNLALLLNSLQSQSLTEAESKQIQHLQEWVDGIISGKFTFEKLQKKIITAYERLLPLFERQSPMATDKNFPFALIPDLEVDLSFGQEFLAKCAEVHFEDLDLLEQWAIQVESHDTDAIKQIKRLLHTLKGDFGVIGINSYSEWIHQLEDLYEKEAPKTDHLLNIKDFLFEAFTAFRSGYVPQLTPEILSYLLNVSKTHTPEIHGVPEVIESIPENPTTLDAPPETPTADAHLPSIQIDIDAIRLNLEEDASLIADFIIESKEGIELVLPQILEIDSGDFEVVNRLFRTCHTIKGLCGFIGLQRFGTFAHVLEDLLSKLRTDQIQITEPLIALLQESFDVIYELILAIEKMMAGQNLKYPKALETIYIQLQQFDHNPQTTSKADDINVDEWIAQQQLNPAVDTEFEEEKSEALPNPAQDENAQLKVRKNTDSKIELDEMIRVSTKKLDQLIDTIGETVIAQSMLEADPRINELQDLILEKKLAQSNLLIRRIQELSMSLRMVPIQGVFQKMSRLIRDLSKKMDKTVVFETVGEDTELDKSIVEQIADPLMHMVRNSMDHGLENTTERVQNGKPAQGTLKLKAFNRSGAIYIEIEDDGRGLDPERILAKAINQELCTKEEAANLNDQEIFRFIFQPGFSTAAKITDVSGRGVGMDVVKKNIDALRGSIVITSELGKGTLFSIRLPLTLAIIDGMVVRSGAKVLIIPTLSIIQSVKCVDKRHLVQEPDGHYLFDILGQMIPIIGLAQLYQLTEIPANINESVVIIVEDMEGNRLGILVDEIVGQQQIVIKNIGLWIGAVAGIAGGAIMNSGEISLIVDIPELIRMAKHSESLKKLEWIEAAL